jgi:glucose/arabinose dehydrogenase
MALWRILGVAAVGALAAAACSSGPGGAVRTSLPRSTAPSLPPSDVRPVLVAKVEQPLGMAVRSGDTALYIVGRKGRVWAIRDGRVDHTPALDLSGQVATGSEQGLLGLAFSPDGRFAYVNYTDRNGNSNVIEYEWRDGRADPSTRRVVLFVRQPFPNHNGGDLVFGPDGDLYVGLGDGGSDYSRGDPWGDPDRNGQNLAVLLGKMLRIEPRLPDASVPSDGRYAIPPDNPFVARKGARPEIWAYGLRNPWRYSFDPKTRDLWIGDVGAGAREEVDFQPASSQGGENYGWNSLEGTVAYRAPPPEAVSPVYEYDHRSGGCAVTGGYVYRGTALPNLVGWYVFSDFCSGAIRALRLAPGGSQVRFISGVDIEQLASFGQDQEGELYALSLAGGVYKLEP